MTEQSGPFVMTVARRLHDKSVGQDFGDEPGPIAVSRNGPTRCGVTFQRRILLRRPFRHEVAYNPVNRWKWS